MKEEAMARIGELIGEALSQPDNDEHLEAVRGKVKELAAKYPIYTDLLEATPAI
jgi:glycine/serine hydroxymethyltransferase